MKFGVCTSIDKAEIVQAAGFDFIECTVGSLKPEAPDAEVVETLEKFAKSPIRVAAFNVLLAAGLNVIGPEVDQERILRYLQTAFQRIRSVGGHTVVFGSGRARNIPEGYDRTTADQQMEWFLNTLADTSEANGITVVIEPLNKEESNTINTVQEAHDWVKRINRPTVKALADWYHMRKDGESPEALVACQDELAHLHIAGLERYAPAAGDDCDQFAEQVKRIGYKGLLSVECKWKDFDQEVEDVGKYLHQLFA